MDDYHLQSCSLCHDGCLHSVLWSALSGPVGWNPCSAVVVCPARCITRLLHSASSITPLSTDNEQLARSGTNCLENLAVSVGKQFLPDSWDRVCHCIRDIYLASVPHQLLSWKPDDNTMRRYVYNTLKCLVCLVSIHFLGRIPPYRLGQHEVL